MDFLSEKFLNIIQVKLKNFLILINVYKKKKFKKIYDLKKKKVAVHIRRYNENHIRPHYNEIGTKML